MGLLPGQSILVIEAFALIYAHKVLCALAISAFALAIKSWNSSASEGLLLLDFWVLYFLGALGSKQLNLLQIRGFQKSVQCIIELGNAGENIAEQSSEKRALEWMRPVRKLKSNSLFGKLELACSTNNNQKFAILRPHTAKQTFVFLENESN